MLTNRRAQNPCQNLAEYNCTFHLKYVVILTPGYDFEDRVTCNTLGADAVRTLTTVGSFPGYDGDASIEGTVQIAFKGTVVEMTYDLSGVEAECSTRKNTLIFTMGQASFMSRCGHH